MKRNLKYWSEFECSDSVAINIPGFRKNAYIHHDMPNAPTNLIYLCINYSPVVVIYQNPNNKMDDVLIEFHIHNYESNTTKPIPRNIIERYLEPYPELSLVDIDGRCFVEFMNDIFGLEFASKHFLELLFQFLYPKINSIDASKEVIEAFDRFVRNISSIKEEKYELNKRQLMDKIKEERKIIEEQLSLIEDCATRSADAMNELSEKYGIEVVLTDE